MFWFALAFALDIQVLTVSPGADLFSSMGHTVLVVPQQQEEVVIDFAVMKPVSVLDFLRGRAEVETLVYPKERWLSAVMARGRTVVTNTVEIRDEAAFLQRLERQKTTPVRYDWKERNCSTVVRDLVSPSLPGWSEHLKRTPAPRSARADGARHLSPWPVLRFAWLFVVSEELDATENAWQALRVPENLSFALPNRSRSKSMIPQHQTNWWWAVPGLLGSFGLFSFGPKLKGASMLLFSLALSLLGLCTLGVWGLSGISGVGFNANILLAGPQSMLLFVAGYKQLKQAAPTIVEVYTTVSLAGLGVVSVVIAAGVGLHNIEAVIAFLPGLLACSSVTMLRWRSFEQSGHR